MKLKVKSNVKRNVTFQMAVWLGWVKAEWERAGLGPFVVTSLKDGKHRPGSKHKQDKPAGVPGQAVDIRTWHLWSGPKTAPFNGEHQKKMIQFAKGLQRNGLAVVVHPDWVGGTPHLHIATKRSIIQRVN